MKAETGTRPRLDPLKNTSEIIVPPGELGAVLELIVRNKDGEITRRQEMLSKSFLKGFMQLWWVMSTFVYGGGQGKWVRDKDGDYRWAITHSQNFNANASTGQTDGGILAGTGTTAPTIDDYQMEAQIAEGTGAGQMQHSAVTFGAPTSDGVASHFTVTRDFSNYSGSPITVREVGLQVYFSFLPGSNDYLLLLRDAVNIDIPNGETLTVNYRIQATA